MNEMTISKFFLLAAIAALFLAAAVPATAMMIDRIARRHHRFDLAANVLDLGQELGLWFGAVSAFMFAAAVWWR